MKTLETGSILGVMGSGQLGRMFAASAIRQGYNVSCYSPEKNTPSGKVGVREYIGEYSDSLKLETFLHEIDALTFEFENIPEPALQTIEKVMREKKLRVHPSPDAIRISQNRIREKLFFQKIGLTTTQFYSFSNLQDFKNKEKQIIYPCILKINQFGYDGKGQKKIHSKKELEESIEENGFDSVIIEEIVNFQKELSIILARLPDGTILTYPVSENIHKNHILDMTKNPGDVSENVAKTCKNYANLLATKLNYVGVLGLEFFLYNDKIICNEFAPRPHNSGHFSMNGYNLSQFDLQVRSLCNLPFPERLEGQKCIMKNLLGEDMEALEKSKNEYFKSSNYHLHLYGKDTAKKGRKMGHWNYIGDLNVNNVFF